MNDAGSVDIIHDPFDLHCFTSFDIPVTKTNFDPESGLATTITSHANIYIYIYELHIYIVVYIYIYIYMKSISSGH